MHLTRDQQQQVLGIVSENPWGDTAGSLALIDEALAIAMRATLDEFIHWEQLADANGFVDEFSINDVSALSPEWRHALVARLLRSIAMAYGVGTDFSRDEIGQVDPDWSGAATPLRALLTATAGDKQAAQDTSTAADIESWEGDWETLRGYEDRLCAEPDLCDRVFASKHEAFAAAYALATADITPTRLQPRKVPEE